MNARLLIFFVLTVVARPDSETDPEVLRRIEDKEDIVNRLAEEVANVFQERSSYLRRCQCSRHSCSNDITDFHCTKDLGKVEAVCGKDCEGRKVSFNTSEFRTPPNTDINQLSPRVKESVCLYANLEPLMKELVPATDPSWVYFGGVDGVTRMYPATPQPRGVKNGDKALGECESYDPRIKPWFVGASTRPKDIVFVIDRSSSMNHSVNGESLESRWEVTKRAVVTMLGTLASFDYVNVVAFSDKPERLYTNGSLLQGTKENLDSLISKVEDEEVGRWTNFNAAFRDAFRILTDACDEDTEQDSCSGCQKIILFLTDGRDTSQGYERSISATQILNNIEEYQRELEQVTSKRASIFTFSVGDTSDDSIPRQIACANNGSWSFIGPETDTLTAMNSYYHFLTSADSNADPIWINPYEDDKGLGLITTVSKPVYSRGTTDLDGIFLGVVGLDVTRRELEVPHIPWTEVIDALRARSQFCNLTPQTPCQLQVHRNAYANKAICADNISPTYRSASNDEGPTGGSTCYQLSDKFYKLFQERVNWDKASRRCGNDGGRLVVIESEEEFAFVAGVSSPDGSWISARRSGNRNRFEWTDRRITNELLKPTSASWGVGEPNNYDGVEDCVHIDRRGANGNLNDEDCSKQLSFICEYYRENRCDTVVNTPSIGYFEIPPLSVCAQEENSLANARPSKAAENLKRNDVMCPLGTPKDTFDVICCDECRRPEDERKRGRKRLP